MEILLEPSGWIILALVSLIAGFIDAIIGGGGLLTIPTLLTLGMPSHLALGTNKLAACFGSSMAAYTYYKKQLLQPQFWIWAFGATAIGAILGCALVYWIDASCLNKILPVLIIIIAVYTLFTPNALERHDSKPVTEQPNPYHQVLQGLGLGAYDGFAGPGIGAFWSMSSISLYKLPFLNSCALARTMTFVSNITALTVFLYIGEVHIVIGLIMGGCMMVGSFIGAHSAIKFGMPFIRPLFISVVIAIAVNLAWSAWL